MIITALSVLFILIVSLTIILIKLYRMEQSYKNILKREEKFLENKAIEIFVVKKKEENNER